MTELEQQQTATKAVTQQESDVVMEHCVTMENGDKVTQKRRAPFNGKTWIVFIFCMLFVTIIIIGFISLIAIHSLMGYSIGTSELAAAATISFGLGLTICYLAASLITGTFKPYIKPK